jgi:two-component sensor histidine kinase
MRVDDEEKLKRELALARCRVASLISLADSHRLLSRSKPGWQAEMESYLKRLAAAHVELERLERH